MIETDGGITCVDYRITTFPALREEWVDTSPESWIDPFIAFVVLLLLLLLLLLLFCCRYTFASASPDNIKQWKYPDGNFLQNLAGHNAILNCLAVNSDNVLVSGGMAPVLLFELRHKHAHCAVGKIVSICGGRLMETSTSASK